MSELPKGWVSVFLNEVAVAIHGGGTPSKNIAEYFSGDVPFMTVKDMKTFRPSDTQDKISEAALQSCSSKLIPAGTPIVCTRMGLGKIVILSFATAINQDLKAVFLEQDLIDNEYFNFWYRSAFKKINAMGAGTTVKGITLKQLQGLQIPLPPLAEQVHIAKKLDELLTQVDILKARIDAIPALLKHFRQSVLAAAVSGRLTEAWRFQRNHLEQAYSIVQLSSVTSKISDGEHLTPPMTESGVPLLSAKDVKTNHLKFDQCRYVSREVAEKALSRCNPTRNDILIVSRGATVGRTHRVRTDREFCLMGSVLLIRPSPESIIPEYLEISFTSAEGQQQLIETSGSSAQQAIYIRDVKNFSLSLPSLEEQTEIVRRVEQLFAFTDQLEAKVTSAKSRIDHLTQSILAKALRGELVPQDPNDEPASMLLERIKTQRAAAPKAKRGQKGAYV